VFKNFFSFIIHIVQNKKLLLTFVKNDFKQQYLGSQLGLIWAFLQPIFMLCIMWFVFQVGFKAEPVSDVPFILWLSCGMIPWFFFADSVSNGTNSIVSNSYLVKKVLFRVSMLPLVKIISAFYIHIFFIFFLMAMFIIYGYSPSLYWIQIPYYVVCTFILVLGISWLTSSLNVFFRDIGQIIAVFLQFGFWGTPIFWQLDTIPEAYQWIIKLNPMYYIIEGYRNSFIEHIWFWETYKMTPYFIITTLVIFIVGAITFKKLRPHFADVL